MMVGDWDKKKDEIQSVLIKSSQHFRKKRDIQADDPNKNKTKQQQKTTKKMEQMQQRYVVQRKQPAWPGEVKKCFGKGVMFELDLEG